MRQSIGRAAAIRRAFPTEVLVAKPQPKKAAQEAVGILGK